MSDNYLRVYKYKPLLTNYTPSFDPFVVKKKKKKLIIAALKTKKACTFPNLCATFAAPPKHSVTL